MIFKFDSTIIVLSAYDKVTKNICVMEPFSNKNPPLKITTPILLSLLEWPLQDSPAEKPRGF